MGGAVLGICGGFQMLGRHVADPAGVEGEPGARADGLGLLDVHTTFGAEKVLARPTGRALGAIVSGYEIHHGRVEIGGDEAFLAGARRGAVFGTMWHGCLEGDEFRAAWLNTVADLADVTDFRPGSASFPAAREARIDAIADAIERHLDLEAILALVEHGPTPGLRPVPGGLV
jgi:adenosylcobyric acid synthase